VSTGKQLFLIWSPQPWKEDLIWCPSQLYKSFRIEVGGFHTLLSAQAYCRWRHSDPWTAEVMRDGDTHFWLTQSISSRLKLPHFKDQDYRALEAWGSRSSRGLGRRLWRRGLQARRSPFDTRGGIGRG
jgi:hypothetical protein